MRSALLAAASLALLAVCVCAPLDGAVIQHIPPKEDPTPSLTAKDGLTSGAVEGNAAAAKLEPARVRRNAAQENDLLPASNDAGASPFEASNLEGRGRIKFISAGISPVHDIKEQMAVKFGGEGYLLNSPHKVLKQLDNSILKATKNVTQNPKMEENLYQISKDLVSAILSKLDVQDKITRITRDALEAPDKSKGITAIETRRILDYLSRTLSGHILSITKISTEPELHRLVYGLAQIAAEISIVAALKDITYPSALSKKQSVDLSLRKKRATTNDKFIRNITTPVPDKAPMPSIYNVILNKTDTKNNAYTNSTLIPTKNKLTPYTVFSRNEKKPLILLNTQLAMPTVTKGFLNQTALDLEQNNTNVNETDGILIQNAINGTHYVVTKTKTLENQEVNAPELMDDWLDPKDYKSPLRSDIVAELELDQVDGDEELINSKKAKAKLERLEVKAKKAILYAGDVAYLTAASVVALRRALTASIEVKMSVAFAKNGMTSHQDLMMNLAKTAAQQAGKEAKVASSKSLACERVIKLALKYTAQSYGANLNHVANRVIMDTLSLATLAKSMAFVSSDIAINSLYQATEIKPPS
ncbi:uncharacterized protein LOC106132547 [Amyelois transitella]|uniref:uncharacterized protein LOC106132547 n=1 Tax=Amyelois transitella TaxID=680683 RepID=UPI00298FE975|nr:uncharacterized protein LOC106132547 [Amyelois transitella]